jgi:hypothetical protein
MRKSFAMGAVALTAATGALFLNSCEESGRLDFSNISHAELRKREVKVKEGAQPIKETGKIYVKDNFLYVNEKGKGIHVIDNSDPAAPKKVKFVSIPGNLDVAMKGDMLYADSYMDLLAINMKTQEVNRVNDVFQGSFEQMRTQGRFAGTNSDGSFMFSKSMQAVNNTSSGASTGGGTGTAGSMARFAIVKNSLYVLDGSTMKIFDITDGAKPKEGNSKKMDFEIETIFPHENELYIGGTRGMFIYDNTDPTNPTLLSKFEHLFSCDPVVVEGKTAYITLRNGTPCRTTANQLDIVDISDLKNPVLIKSYPMHNPHGLSIQGSTLYVCDGNQGLKSFNVSDPMNIQPTAKDPSLRKAYDVIALGGTQTLIVVGRDGIYQYDNSDVNNLKQLSVIAVEESAS